MEVVWFQRIKSLRQLYHTATEYILFGKPSNFNGRWSMVHPEVDTPENASAQGGFRGVYPLTEQLRNRGFSSRTFANAATEILAGDTHCHRDAHSADHHPPPAHGATRSSHRHPFSPDTAATRTSPFPSEIRRAFLSSA